MKPNVRINNIFPKLKTKGEQKKDNNEEKIYNYAFNKVVAAMETVQKRRDKIL